MKDEEFKKKLESILENLYKIDREVGEYFGRKINAVGSRDYSLKSNSKNDPIILDKKYNVE